MMRLFLSTTKLQKQITKQQLYFALLFSVSFGTIMEVIQHFLPWRSGSIYDFIANTLGVIIAIILFRIINYKSF